ncbi:MAG TPA: phosphohydrolase [Chryseobacterium sp.]|nr:phosphohydrolase [Chryseobacterium sp.]
MSSHELLYKAIKLATKAHKKQTDKYGAPYLGHVFRVMNAGKTIDEKIVGALHDVVEDVPDYDFAYLREKGFPEHIIFAVDCLTKRENEETDYDAFLKRTEQSSLAVAVKLNDLRDNMDLTRLPGLLEEKDLKRFNKYLKAYLYLTENY